MKDVLKNIQQYDPPDELWERISLRLNDKALKQALKDIQQYSPSDDVWKQLEFKLEAKAQSKSWKYWQAAASILIVFSFGIWLLSLSKKEIFVVSSKPFQEQLSHLEPSKTDQAYQAIQQMCQQQKYTCEQIDYKTLNDEYLNLKKAEDELQAAIGNYNSEPILIEELSRIEKQKIRLINEMAEKI